MSRRHRTRFSKLGRLLKLMLVILAIGSAAFVYHRWQFREQRYNKLIEEIAGQTGVDKFLVKAVIRQESGFDPFAYSSKGAIGLMQVMPATGEDWARATGRKDFEHSRLWDERVNIEAGTWCLARALRNWQGRDNPVPFALAEYNAGFRNVLRWLPKGQATTAAEFQSAITFPGVRRYIETVTEFYEYYRANAELQADLGKEESVARDLAAATWVRSG